MKKLILIYVILFISICSAQDSLTIHMDYEYFTHENSIFIPTNLTPKTKDKTFTLHEKHGRSIEGSMSSYRKRISSHIMAKYTPIDTNQTVMLFNSKNIFSGEAEFNQFEYYSDLESLYLTNYSMIDEIFQRQEHYYVITSNAKPAMYSNYTMLHSDALTALKDSIKTVEILKQDENNTLLFYCDKLVAIKEDDRMVQFAVYSFEITNVIETRRLLRTIIFEIVGDSYSCVYSKKEPWGVMNAMLTPVSVNKRPVLLLNTGYPDSDLMRGAIGYFRNNTFRIVGTVITTDVGFNN